MSLFDKAIYVHVSAYYGIDYKTFSMPLHSHKRCEIMYIAQGQCRIDTADSSAIFREHDFIFLDEPISHLDNDNSAIMSRLLMEEAGKQGAGIIVTSIGKHLELEYDATFRL